MNFELLSVFVIRSVKTFSVLSTEEGTSIEDDIIPYFIAGEELAGSAVFGDENSLRKPDKHDELLSFSHEGIVEVVFKRGVMLLRSDTVKEVGILRRGKVQGCER